MRQFSFDKAIWKNVGRAAAVVCLLLFSLPALAQSGGDYKISWYTIDGGGGRF